MEKHVPMPQAAMNRTTRFLALAVVGGLMVWVGAMQSRLARGEREQLQLQAAHQELAVRYEQATAEIETLREQLSVARPAGAEGAGPRPRATGTGGKAPTQPGVQPDPSGVWRTASPDAPPSWSLPAEVDAGIVRRFGPLAVREVQPSVHQGRPAYMVQGTTADGRSVGVMIASDGTVLTSKSELLPDALPAQVAGAVRELSGHTTIEKAREIFSSDGGLEYALSGQLEDGGRIHLNMSADGHITSGEAERSADALPEPVRTTLTQTVADRSPSSVRQLFGGKGTFYEIGFAGDAERIHLVIDESGRLVSFASKADLAPAQPGEKPKP